MQKKLRRAQCFGILVILFLSLFGPRSVFSESLISEIIITDVDYGQFPVVSVTARVNGDTREPIPDLDENDLYITEIVIEDGQELSRDVDFSIQKVHMGIQVALVLDIGSYLYAEGYTGINKWEEMKTITRQIFDSMDEKDNVELIIVQGKDVITLVDFTSDKDSLISSLEGLEVRGGNPLTNGLDGVEKALSDLDTLPDTQKPLDVLLITPGIQDTSAGEGTQFGEVERLALDYNIPVHTVVVGTGYDTERELREFVETTRAYFNKYTSENVPEGLYDFLDRQRDQYQFSYHTQSPSPHERKVVISTNPELGVGSSDSHTFTVTPAPQSPELLELIVNDGDPIVRTVDKADSDLNEIPLTEVEVIGQTIKWPDNYPRKIKEAQLWIDDQKHGPPLVYPRGEEVFTFIWDLRSLIEPGITTVKVEIQLIDTLGLTASKAMSIPVEVIIPEPEPGQETEQEEVVVIAPSEKCSPLEKIPYIGNNLVRVCSRYGITSTQMAIILSVIVITILVIIALFNRGKVKGAGDFVADAVIRVTQQLMGRRKPKALLYVFEEPSGNEIEKKLEIYGETPIGNDREYAELVFDQSNVSPLHFTIHEAGLNGSWSIEDKESAEGTYLNGERLTPLEPAPLQDGDVIEVARGLADGIKFKFIIIDYGYSDTWDTSEETVLGKEIEDVYFEESESDTTLVEQEEEFDQIDQVEDEGSDDEPADYDPYDQYF